MFAHQCRDPALVTTPVNSRDNGIDDKGHPAHQEKRVVACCSIDGDCFVDTAERFGVHLNNTGSTARALQECRHWQTKITSV